MRIPEIEIQYHYQFPRCPGLLIRYGRSYDGKYFFEVFRDLQHGGSWQWSSRWNKNGWAEFMDKLEEQDIHTRLKVVNRVIKKLKRELNKRDITLLGVYKFKPKTLFTLKQ